MVPNFLHLEDEKQSQFLTELNINGQLTSQQEPILEAIFDFYSNLYLTTTSNIDSDIDHFLHKIPSIPWVSLTTDDLLSPVSVTEVENAIKKLCSGKIPGLDGLTSEFYKHFC